MYTVIRFHTDEFFSAEAVRFFRDTCQAQERQEIDTTQSVISLDVSSESDCDAHLQAIGTYVQKNAELIAGMQQRGCHTGLDIAVFKEDDLQGKFLFSIPFDHSLLARLAEQKISLEISVYANMRNDDPQQR